MKNIDEKSIRFSCSPAISSDSFQSVLAQEAPQNSYSSHTANVKKIILASGKVALIDTEDFEIVSMFPWHEKKDRFTSYAKSNIEVGGKYYTILMHRLIMNANKGEIVDHRNFNGLDNRKINLRKCTLRQNLQHREKHIKTASIYKGVCWSIQDGRWKAQIRDRRHKEIIGLFIRELDAALAYDDVVRKLRGEYAVCNFTM